MSTPINRLPPGGDTYNQWASRYDSPQPLTLDTLRTFRRALGEMARRPPPSLIFSPEQFFYFLVYRDEVPPSGCRDRFTALRRWRFELAFKKWRADGCPLPAGPTVYAGMPVTMYPPPSAATGATSGPLPTRGRAGDGVAEERSDGNPTHKDPP